MKIGIIDGLQELTRSEQVDVGTSNVIVADARMTLPKRKVITVRNTSDDATKIITISFGTNPASNQAGIVLRQYESFTDASGEGYECYQGQINAISAVAASKLSIFER